MNLCERQASRKIHPNWYQSNRIHFRATAMQIAWHRVSYSCKTTIQVIMTTELIIPKIMMLQTVKIRIRVKMRNFSSTCPIWVNWATTFRSISRWMMQVLANTKSSFLICKRPLLRASHLKGKICKDSKLFKIDRVAKMCTRPRKFWVQLTLPLLAFNSKVTKIVENRAFLELWRALIQTWISWVQIGVKVQLWTKIVAKMAL